MITHKGTVVRIADDQATITITRTGSCEGCTLAHHCTRDEFVVPAEDLVVGQSVQVQLHEHIAWKALFIAYILPFIVLMTTMVVLSVCHCDETLVAVIVLAVVALYFLILHMCRHRLQRTIHITVVRDE